MVDGVTIAPFVDACIEAANGNVGPLIDVAVTSPETLACAPALLARAASWVGEGQSPEAIERLSRSTRAGYAPRQIERLWRRMLTGRPLSEGDSIEACIVSADLAARVVSAAEGESAALVLASLTSVALDDLAEAAA